MSTSAWKDGPTGEQGPTCRGGKMNTLPVKEDIIPGKFKEEK